MDLIQSAKHRISPLQKVMGPSDYWRAKRYPAFKNGTGRVNGSPIKFSDANGFLHSVQEVFIDEVYRFKASVPAPRIIDAGANIGLSILYFKTLYPQSQIIAFEPDPAIFELLQANIKDLHFSDVELHESAAWIEDTTLSFYSEGSLAGSTEVDFLSKGEVRAVKAERLKTVLEEAAVDFLKIDIEGAENRVLFDIEDALQNVQHLFFEYHGQHDRPQMLGDLLELVKRAGYRYIINGAHGPKYPFVNRMKNGFDLQLNVSCYRP